METVQAKKKKVSASNFRLLLREELLERCRVNPNYSLRSFARSLEVEPSALSQMINGKRTITEKMKLRLGLGMGLNREQIRKLPTSDESTDLKETLNFQQITLDTFAIISDWYHYAILELTYIDGFTTSPLWISKRLGISVSEAKIGVERLLRLKLLHKNKDNKWADASVNGELSHLTPSTSSDAARKFQCQLLELSKRSVQETPVSKRNHTSMTLSFDPEDLPLAIERIAEFRRSFAREFRPQNAKEVYQLQISFFPLTKQKEDL